MEDLKQKIQSDINEASKKGDEISRDTLRMLSAAILTKEKEKRYKASKTDSSLSEEKLSYMSSLTDEEIVEVIFSEVKKRKEAAVEYEKGKREELKEKELKEADVLKRYLPEQMSYDELKVLAEEAVSKTGAKDIKDMGRVMAELMPKVKGKAEGREISKAVKEILSK